MRRLESSTLHKPANFFPPVPLSLRMGTMMGLYECVTPCELSFCCWRRRHPLARWHLPTTVGFLAAFFEWQRRILLRPRRLFHGAAGPGQHDRHWLSFVRNRARAVFRDAA